MEAEAAFYEGAIRRIVRFMVVIAVAGAVFTLAWRGWQDALAFSAGAVGAYYNFRWLHQLVEALGPGGRRVSKRTAILFAGRYLILGAGAYAIVKIFGLNLVAALLGLLAPVAAVIVEILYELVYART